MSITKIHLFSKNTDAVASVKGYEYQKLKTLEAWLQNGVDQKDELIYCEYEEDIFHRNVSSQTSKFRQLKLYSSNFSFSSEEIKKAIIHFFDLFTKGEYLFDDLSFVFEANSDVAREYAENEAQLLKLWFENQLNLEPELLKQCITKIKAIVSEYYAAEYEKLKKETNGVPPEIEKSYKLFKELKDDRWEQFVKCIKWKFDGLKPDQAVVAINENINRLILTLPHYIEKDSLSSVFGVLYLEVSQRTIQSKPEDRVLDLSLLDKIILDHGTEEDRWYSGVLDEWSQVKSIDYVYLGEFFELLDAARHCRRNKNLWKHAENWLTLLEKYFEHKDLSDVFKRKCIYEIVWLKMKADPETLSPTGTLKEIDDKLKFYFQDVAKFESIQELEDALNLISILIGATAEDLTNFEEKEVVSLIKNFHSKILTELENTTEPNRKCDLLELLGFIRFTLHKKLDALEFEEIIKPLYDIIPLLDAATLYNVTQLGRRINQIISMLIRLGYDSEQKVITGLEKYSEEIEPYVTKRDGNYKVAKINVEKGVAFIQSKQKNGTLKALNYFHKATGQYLADETMEGYVLGVLNLAQLYSSIGLNFAAKYYALTSLWISINNEKGKLLKRIPQSFGFLFHLDFQQGAWLNALATFGDFVKSKFEFDNGFHSESDEIFLKTFSEISLMMYAIPQISPQLDTQLTFIKKSLGVIYDENIKFLVEELEQTISSDKLQLIIEGKLDDLPLNDIGKTRTVKWNALGIKWQVSFENNAITNSIAEEYCAILQVFLCEIALSDTDFHLLKSKVIIHIEIGEKNQKPEQIGGNREFEYKIVLQQLVTKDVKEINVYNASIGASLSMILSNISLLKFEEFVRVFELLFSKQLVASKAYTINTYQRIYREFFNDALYKLDQRANYQEANYEGKLPKDNALLKWQDNLSPKYEADKAIEFIKNRYEKAHKVMHMTLESLKNNVEFKKTIKNLREQGWLDWQIILAMMNFIVDYKMKEKIGDKDFATEEERFSEMNKHFQEILNQDEKEFAVYFPAEAFETEHLNRQFVQLPLYVLRSWGLESRAKLPNFKAIQDFLNVRFRFNADDLEEGNLLKDF